MTTSNGIGRKYTGPENIRVIIYKSSCRWFAQGLEHDICVQAQNIDDLPGRFEVAVRLEAEDGLKRIPPAPLRFHDMWRW
jgi:hypothetical protein